MSNPPWTPTRRPGEEHTALPLSEAIGQSLGAASACWENLQGAGVFDSLRCAGIYDWLMAYLEDWARECRRQTADDTIDNLFGAPEQMPEVA